MDMMHLTYYSCLCETLNYTEAASKCFISRQAMRQSLRTLEQAFGVRLIENRHNRLSLTVAGQILYEKTQPVLSSMDELTAAMQACVLSGKSLQIGISRSLTPFYAPEILQAVEAFIRDYPGISVTVSLLPSDEILDRCRKKELDAGILVDMGQLPLSWRRTVLRQDTLTVLLAASHPLASRHRLTLSDLDGQTVLLMGEPEVFFPPLAKAVRQRQLSVHWQVAPDFYEVGYHVLKDHFLALDRQDSQNTGGAPTSPDVNLSLEDGAFTLCAVLLTPEAETDPIRLLRHELCGVCQE